MVLAGHTLIRFILGVGLVSNGAAGKPTEAKPDSLEAQGDDPSVWDDHFWDEKKDVDLDDMQNETIDPTGLFYEQYLRRVITVLQGHPEFAKKLEGHSIQEVKNGDFKIELKTLTSQMQEELDDLKKHEVERIREVTKAHDQFLQNGKVEGRATVNHLKSIAEHFHMEVPEKFTGVDITKLLRAAAMDTENFDHERHEQFKKYEMHKQMRKEQKLAHMSPEEREAEQKNLKDLYEKHIDHDPLNQPGHQKQMEELWEEEDGMKDKKFDPKAFFKIHDRNSDGYWDQTEVEAMLDHELHKAWDEDNKEDDLVERNEEKLRMREQMFQQMDTNNDKMISEEEWLHFQKTEAYKDEDPWESIDDLVQKHKVFSTDEMKKFKTHVKESEDKFTAELGKLIDIHEQMKAHNKNNEHGKLQPADGETISQHQKEVADRQTVLADLVKKVNTMAQDVGKLHGDFLNHGRGNSTELDAKLNAIELQQKEMMKEAEEKIAEIASHHKIDL